MENRYPPHQSVYSRFCKWREDSTLETVFHILNTDDDLENLRHTHKSAGAKKGLLIQNAIHLLV